MIRSSRERRAELRRLVRYSSRINHMRREQRRATFQPGTAMLPHTARDWLAFAGIDDEIAKRFAGAFSAGVQADLTMMVKIRIPHQADKTVPVKLYRRETFLTRLATYRPRDPQYRALFAETATRTLEAA